MWGLYMQYTYMYMLHRNTPKWVKTLGKWKVNRKFVRPLNSFTPHFLVTYTLILFFEMIDILSHRQLTHLVRMFCSYMWPLQQVDFQTYRFAREFDPCRIRSHFFAKMSFLSFIVHSLFFAAWILGWRTIDWTLFLAGRKMMNTFIADGTHCFAWKETGNLAPQFCFHLQIAVILFCSYLSGKGL